MKLWTDMREIRSAAGTRGNQRKSHPPAPAAMNPATLTFRVGCDADHVIDGIRPSPISS
jgi:hypothetical protein